MIKINISKVITVMLISALLIGCSSLLTPVKVPSTTLYKLDATPSLPIKRTHHRTVILVTLPETNAIYNTTQIAYTLKPYQIAYFARNRWADTPPKMLQPLIIQTLQNTQYFSAITTASSARHYHFILNTQLLELQQSFSEGNVVHLRLRGQLVNATNSHVIATKVFSVSIPAPEENPYGGVIAANRATRVVLRQLAIFCLQYIK